MTLLLLLIFLGYLKALSKLCEISFCSVQTFILNFSSMTMLLLVWNFWGLGYFGGVWVFGSFFIFLR